MWWFVGIVALIVFFVLDYRGVFHEKVKNTWDAEETIKTVGMERILTDLIEVLDELGDATDDEYIDDLHHDLIVALESYKQRNNKDQEMN